MKEECLCQVSDKEFDLLFEIGIKHLHVYLTKSTFTLSAIQENTVHVLILVQPNFSGNM